MSIETRRDNQALLPRIKTSAYKLMRRILKAEVCLVSKETQVFTTILNLQSKSTAEK